MFMLGLTPTWLIWCNGTTPCKGGIWVGSWAQKPAISLKRCEIGPGLLWRTNWKSHTRFRFVSTSMTYWPWMTLNTAKMQSCGKNPCTEPTRKIWMKVNPYYQRQNVGPWFCLSACLSIPSYHGYNRSGYFESNYTHSRVPRSAI